MGVQFCPRCGSSLPLTSRFCGRCGAEVYEPARAGLPRLPVAAVGGLLAVSLVAVTVLLAVRAGAGITRAAGPQSGAHAVSTPVPTPVSTPVPAPTETPAPPAQEAVLDAIDAHWQAIRDHRFEDAYQYIGPGIGMSEQSWVSAHQQDGITDVQYDFSVGAVQGGTATVDILRLQTTAQSARSASNPAGCQSWQGTYVLDLRGDRWVIDQAHLTSSPC